MPQWIPFVEGMCILEGGGHVYAYLCVWVCVCVVHEFVAVISLHIPVCVYVRGLVSSLLFFFFPLTGGEHLIDPLHSEPTVSCALESLSVQRSLKIVLAKLVITLGQAVPEESLLKR